MKRRISISIVLVLSVALLSLMTSDSTAQTQRGRRSSVADTGMFPLGPNQSLRVSVATGDVNGDSDITLRFRRIEYMLGACDSAGVCKYAVSSQTRTNPIVLAPGDAVVFEVSDGLSNTLMGVRGVVESNRPGMKVAAQIIGPTGEVISHIILANTEGDIH